jgi:hypothetical protein
MRKDVEDYLRQTGMIPSEEDQQAAQRSKHARNAQQPQQPQQQAAV